jgi:acylphosphatase
MATIRAAVRVTGRVQGVWFRQSTKQTALRHAVTGWVKNNVDGSVSAVFEGAEEDVKAVIDWCRQGPEMAHVDKIEVVWQKSPEGLSSFKVR